MPKPPPLPTESDPLVGALIEDRWRILERVGAGAMGVVYRAERLKLGKHVAVKVLHEVFCRKKDFVSRFEREARAISRLDHIHCVSILDFGVHARRPYIVMEYIDGRRLTMEIGKSHTTPTRACALMRQVLLGLRHAHSNGVLHRDLKPDNIMLTEVTGTGDLVKILDFGFAHILDADDPSLTDKHIVAGTPSYMSPEQSSGITTDLRSDLYSAAVILFELVCGQKPFWSDDIMQILAMHIHKAPPRPRDVAPKRRISDGLESVIMRGLTKDRDQRYVDAAQFLEALDATPEGLEASRPKLSLSGGHRASGVPALPVEKLVEKISAEDVAGYRRPPRRRRGWGVAAAILILGAVAAGAIVARRYVGFSSDPSEKKSEPIASAGGGEETFKPVPQPAATPTPDALPPPDAAAPPPPDASPSQDAAGIAIEPPRLLEPRAQAEQLLGAGKLVEAERLLLNEKRAHPQSAWVHLELGELYFQKLWRRDAIREWDEAIKLEPSLRHGRTLHQHLCASLDPKGIGDAEPMIVTRYGQGAASLMNECIRTTKDREVLHGAVRILEHVAPARVDRGIVAVRELELAPTCEEQKHAVENIAHLHERRAFMPLAKLEKARLDKNGRPTRNHECLGRLVLDTLRSLK